MNGFNFSIRSLQTNFFQIGVEGFFKINKDYFLFEKCHNCVRMLV